VDWFTSNQDQNDHRPVLHIPSNTFRQQKWFVFVIICYYLGKPHVAAATWPCTYLLCLAVIFAFFNCRSCLFFLQFWSLKAWTIEQWPAVLLVALIHMICMVTARTIQALLPLVSHHVSIHEGGWNQGNLMQHLFSGNISVTECIVKCCAEQYSSELFLLFSYDTV